jgi:hypothetical protein
MESNQQNNTEEQLRSWIKKQLDDTVHELMGLGRYESVIVEAKPAWVFPFGLLIGKIREQNQDTGFDWFICGNFPTVIAPSALADTPREAARHFALQWQLEAERRSQAAPGMLTESESGPGQAAVDSELVKRAESLYELVEQDNLWQE